jgi:hypothetical protein
LLSVGSLKSTYAIKLIAAWLLGAQAHLDSSLQLLLNFAKIVIAAGRSFPTKPRYSSCSALEPVRGWFGPYKSTFALAKFK